MNDWERCADRQLIALAREAQPEAFGELVRRYQAGVFNVAYRMVGERQEALDLAQETFVRAYRSLAQFDSARPFGPWISRIATNLCLNWLQRRRPQQLSLSPDQPGQAALIEEQIADHRANPERAYLASEAALALRTTLLSLPPHYRAVIELRHMQDLSYEEIAQALGLSLSDVKSHLFRARQLLRQRLEGDHV